MTDTFFILLFSKTHSALCKKSVRHLFACVFSAIFLILSHPPYHFWLLAWFALVPFLYVLKDKRFWPAFGLGYLFGLMYCFGMFWWFVHVTLPGMILLNMYLALYFALFGATVSLVPRKPLAWRVILVSCAWVVWEFARAHFLSGFGWACLGHTQYRQILMTQIADMTGVYGISFLLVVVNQYHCFVFRHWRKGHKAVRAFRSFSLIAVCLLVMVIFYGAARVIRFSVPSKRAFKAALVQPNIAQKDKWNPLKHDDIFERLMILSKDALREDPDIIVWPEASLPAFPGAWDTAVGRVQECARTLRTPILLGYVCKKDGAYYNSAGLVSGEGKLVREYDKLHLVPFGEFVPLRRWFPFLTRIVPIGDITAGQKATVFVLEKEGGVYPFSVLVCFEDTVSDVVRRQVKAGAQILVNITNDAWFGDTKAPWLHLQSAVLEAVSYKRPLIRCTNTGVTAAVSSYGKIKRVFRGRGGNAVFCSGILNTATGSRKDTTLSLVFGDIFAYLCIACLCAGVIINNINTKPKI